MYKLIDAEVNTDVPSSPFLETEFNRDGNSYRNPHTNTYHPDNESGYIPSAPYRQLEQNGNVLFAEYIKQYYGNDTIGSFYVMESEAKEGDFSCGFFAKKTVNDEEQFQGAWDSFNIVDVTRNGNEFEYKLTSTVLIEMDIEGNGINLTGFLKKNKEDKKSYGQISEAEIFENHLVTIGELIEDNETVLRQHLEAIYVARTKEVIFTTRYQNTLQEELQRMNLAKNLKEMRFGAN